MKKTIIFASGLHTGGGLVILKSVLESIDNFKNLTLFLDIRVKNKIDIESLEVVDSIFWVKPGVRYRAAAYKKLSRLSSKHDIVLSLNNIPPLFRCKGYITVFLQNIYLVGPLIHKGWKKWPFIKLISQRFLSYIFRKRVDEYIVQTQSMYFLTFDFYRHNTMANPPKITILPFTKTKHRKKQRNGSTKFPKIDFIYIAGAEPHKNHVNLFKAWEHLYNAGVHSNLFLTIPNDEIDMIEKINHMKSKGININNLGNIEHDHVYEALSNSKALIYPSLHESFGLPLLESSSLNLPILASDLDYVYDVCNPAQTFNPNSFLSISRSVMRFLNFQKHIEVHSPEDFTNYISQISFNSSDD